MSCAVIVASIVTVIANVIANVLVLQVHISVRRRSPCVLYIGGYLSPPPPSPLSNEHFRSDRNFLGLGPRFGYRINWVPN